MARARESPSELEHLLLHLPHLVLQRRLPGLPSVGTHGFLLLYPQDKIRSMCSHSGWVSQDCPAGSTCVLGNCSPKVGAVPELAWVELRVGVKPTVPARKAAGCGVP